MIISPFLCEIYKRFITIYDTILYLLFENPFHLITEYFIIVLKFEFVIIQIMIYTTKSFSY